MDKLIVIIIIIIRQVLSLNAEFICFVSITESNIFFQYYFIHFSLIYDGKISSVCITGRHNPIIDFMMEPNFYSIIDSI